MSTISVVINTLNEEKNLPRAISSVKNFADEIIVVDMESSDKTVEIAKALGAKVFTHKKVGYVEPARNFAVSKASGPWVLVLDADEEIPKSLALKIKEIVKKSQSDYFRIPRKNIIFGKWMEHTLWWPDYQIRLFRKGKVIWNELIHAVPVTVGKGADVKPLEKYAITHHNYNSVDQFLERLIRYSKVQADLLVKGEYKFKWEDLIKKPVKEFVNRFFTGEGYKDGIHGLALSLLQAFSELVVFLRIWQEEKYKDQSPKLKETVSVLRQAEKDLHFWESDALYKENGNLVNRIRRKLKI